MRFLYEAQKNKLNREVWQKTAQPGKYAADISKATTVVHHPADIVPCSQKGLRTTSGIVQTSGQV